VESTDEFGDWWDHLTAEEQASLRAYVKLLEEFAVALKHPIGGDKTGNERRYETFVPMADKISDRHLEQLHEEGEI
jgi:hypothetical protein